MIRIFLFLVVISGTVESGRVGGEREGAAFAQTLYKAEEPILGLDADSFDGTVLNAPLGHLVQFYNFWCGHCRKFAPLFSRFARETASWRSVVRVAAVNCADERNRAICNDNSVQFVPFLRYYGRRTRSYNDSVPLRPDWGESGMRHLLVEMVVADFTSSPTASGPNFYLLDNEESLNQVWRTVPRGINYLAIVAETNMSSGHIGAELILDFWQQKSWLAARRAQNSHPIMANLRMRSFPSVVVFKRRDSSAPVLVSKFRRPSSTQTAQDAVSHRLRNMLVDSVLKLSPDAVITADNLMTTTSSTLQTTPSIQSLKSRYIVSETDMLLAIWYALFHEVSFGDRSLSGPRLSALKNFVSLLSKYWPLTEEMRSTLRYLRTEEPTGLRRSQGARRVFRGLEEFLADRQQYGPISANEWRAKFQELEDEYGEPFPKKSDWVSCRGASAQFRGYTCGLWTLFHTLTINSYLEEALAPGFEPSWAVEGIQGWVGHFFGCRHCASHFINMTTNIIPVDNCLTYPSDSVMYLWKAHNIVNKRLKGDGTEDPTFPKRAFPPPFLCRGCGRPSEDPRNGVCGSTRGWNTNRVMRFLLGHYTNITPHDDNHSSSGADFSVPVES